MCIFTNDKDIPSYVRLSTRTLQYLVIPLLSIAIISVGSHHLEDCPAEPNLPIWHIVAGCSGLIVPVLYLIFDELNPWLSKRFPGLSELLDNAIVFIIPVYIIFEVAWLITGTVWVANVDKQTEVCDETIYVFSLVVMVNFWIHLLTPLIFLISVCCGRIFPILGYCAYWKVVKNAIDMWTFKFRFTTAIFVSLPLGAAMLGIGGMGIEQCDPNVKQKLEDTNNIASQSLNSSTSTDDLSWVDYGYLNIPIWLITAGVLLLLLPVVYTVYDKCCKPDDVNAGCKLASQGVVVTYLLFCLAWAIVGFLWIFGQEDKTNCGPESVTYKFAYASLICLNVLMDAWICIKLSIVLYWALLSDDN